jgi:hypothetical protein
MDELSQRPPDTHDSGKDFNLYRHGEHSRPSRFGRVVFWLIALAVVIGLGAWGWHNGWGVRNPNTVSAAPAVAPAAAKRTPMLDVPTLLSSNPADMSGKKIVLRDVLVQSTNGEASIFVGPSKTQQVIVVPEPHAIPETPQGKGSKLESEMVVTITGTVAKPLNSTRAMENDWKISSADAKQVDKTGFYIKASRVDPQNY